MRTWIFLQNPFLNATDNSFYDAMNISSYHDSALAAAQSDEFIHGLYNTFHPLHITYKTGYDTWIAQGGTQASETLNLTQLLQLLANTKIQQWDIKIQNQYSQNTPQYKKLLPSRRKSFQGGTQTDRIHAVQALSHSIGSDTSLVALKADIDSFYTQLDTAYNTQKGSKSTTKNMSTALESAREAMCAAQYANLGALIQKYASSPGIIEQYFDLQTIRKSRQLLFSGHVKAGEVYTIVKHTFGETDQVELINLGPAQLKFYLAGTKDSQPGTAFVTLDKGEQTVLANALGKLTDPYLTVFNTDTSSPINTNFTVELL